MSFELEIKESSKVENPKKKITMLGSQIFEYEIYDLVDEYDLILRTVATGFDFDNPPIHPHYLALSLKETMKHKHGIGLAAPQCGIPYRVITVDIPGVESVMFNPLIVDAKGEVLMQEGCLSFPGLFLKIKRESEVKVFFNDLENKEHEMSFSGLTARTILHEIDHLDGICFTNWVSPVVLAHEKEKVKKNLKKIKKQIEQQNKNEIIAKAVKNLYTKAKQEVDSNGVV